MAGKAEQIASNLNFGAFAKAPKFRLEAICSAFPAI